MRVADGADAEKVRREIAGIVGDDFTVRTRDEMNALFFRLVAYEKWGVFFISLLVLVLASFSVVGTLVMLMIETGRCGHAACPGRRYEGSFVRSSSAKDS